MAGCFIKQGSRCVKPSLTVYREARRPGDVNNIDSKADSSGKTEPEGISLPDTRHEQLNRQATEVECVFSNQTRACIIGVGAGFIVTNRPGPNQPGPRQ